MQATSPAVDLSGVLSTTDLDGRLYIKDMPLVVDRYGFGDISAYELQSIGNLILNLDFTVGART